MSFKPKYRSNAIGTKYRSNAIGKVLDSTAKTLNTGVKTITRPLGSITNSLTGAFKSNSSNQEKPLFDIVPTGGKRKSKKRKSRKHRKTAKK